MTSSQWLDLAVLVVGAIAAVSGWRSGALGSLMSFVGVAGCDRRCHVGPHIVTHTWLAARQVVRGAVPGSRRSWSSVKWRVGCAGARCAVRSTTVGAGRRPRSSEWHCSLW